MKNLVFFLVLVVSGFSLRAQYISRDMQGFGEGGDLVIREDSMDIRPQKLLPTRDGDFLLFTNKSKVINGGHRYHRAQIWKIDYSGNVVTSFAENGRIELGSSVHKESSVADVVRHPEGFFTALLALDGVPYLLRLDQSGMPEAGFGNGGLLNIPGGSMIRLTPDNKLVICGYHYDPDTHGDTLLIHLQRYHVDGQPDTSFAGTGAKIFKISDELKELPSGLIIQDDQKIVVAASVYDGDMGRMLIGVVRLMVNGDIDDHFGTNGVVVQALELDQGYSDIADLHLLQDGSYIVSGNAYYSGGTGGFNGSKPALLKLTPDGRPDSSFSENGIATYDNTTEFGSDDIRCSAVAADGTIIFGASVTLPATMNSRTRITAVSPLSGNIDETYFNKGTDYRQADSSKVLGPDLITVIDNRFYVLAIVYSREFNTYSTAVYRYSGFTSVGESRQVKTRLFPNPVGDLLNIVADDLLESIEICSLDGKTVSIHYNSTVSHSIQLSAASLPSGIYMVKVNTSGGQAIVRLAK